MRQPPQEVYEARLQQLRRENGDLLDYGPDEHIILYYADEPIISTHPPD